MSVCEKCWSDAGGSYERYVELLTERASNPCTPEQQAGREKAQTDDLVAKENSGG
jgi:hypothetical protein